LRGAGVEDGMRSHDHARNFERSEKEANQGKFFKGKTEHWSKESYKEKHGLNYTHIPWQTSE
jgi:hypothetical protein